MYLLDANAFITAHRNIYPFDVYPGYWDWLADALRGGTIGSIRRVRDELTSQEDELQQWVEDQVGMSLEPDDAVIDSVISRLGRRGRTGSWTPPRQSSSTSPTTS